MNIRSPAVGRTLAIAGTLLQLGLVAGLLKLCPFIATLLESGIGDPSSLWPGIVGELLPGAAWELAAVLVGLGLLYLALVGSRYRAGWFFWFLVVYGAVLLSILPIGTAFGVFLLFYCLSRRREFRRTAVN